MLLAWGKIGGRGYLLFTRSLTAESAVAAAHYYGAAVLVHKVYA